MRRMLVRAIAALRRILLCGFLLVCGFSAPVFADDTRIVHVPFRPPSVFGYARWSYIGHNNLLLVDGPGFDARVKGRVVFVFDPGADPGNMAWLIDTLVARGEMSRDVPKPAPGRFSGAAKSVAPVKPAAEPPRELGEGPKNGEKKTKEAPKSATPSDPAARKAEKKEEARPSAPRPEPEPPPRLPNPSASTSSSEPVLEWNCSVVWEHPEWARLVPSCVSVLPLTCNSVREHPDGYPAGQACVPSSLPYNVSVLAKKSPTRTGKPQAVAANALGVNVTGPANLRTALLAEIVVRAPGLPGPPDWKCVKIAAAMEDLIYAVRPPTPLGGKPQGYQGLAERWREYAENRGNWGYQPNGKLGERAQNHIDEYDKHRKRLDEKVKEWEANQCDDKGPLMPRKAREYSKQMPELGPGKPLEPVTLPTPLAPAPSSRLTPEAIAATLGVSVEVVFGIVIATRIVRLLPPLWWSQASPF